MAEPTPLTPSQKTYLGAIHDLAGSGPVQAKELAARVGVKLPSVSRAVGGLSRLGLVTHESYGRIELTERGAVVGRHIARRRTCLRRLLVEVLGLAPTEADKEVGRLEHTVSDRLLARLEVLNDFALSSDGWIRRLRVRLRPPNPN
jgi:DtxR family Mn-dependent transcriptional regulator